VHDWYREGTGGERYYDGKYSAWAPIDKVEVTHLGTAKPGTKKGVICASFNAG